MVAAKQGGLAVTGPLDVKTAKYGERGLVVLHQVPVTGIALFFMGLSQYETLVGRAYITPLKSGLSLVSSWMTPSSLATTYPTEQQLDQIARTVSTCRPIPALRASIPDTMRGLNAYHILLPHGATLAGHVYPDGGLACTVEGRGYTIRFQSSPRYVDPGSMGMNPFFAQSLAMQGATVIRCMSARDYAYQVLSSMGAQPEESYNVGPIPVTIHSIMEALGLARGGMGRGFYDSTLARFKTSGSEGYLWVTTYGLQAAMLAPYTMWRAVISYIVGPPDRSEQLLSLLFTVMSGLTADQKWLQTVRAEAMRKAKETIRGSRAIHWSIMRSIRDRSQLWRQVQETFRDTSEMVMDNFYSGMEAGVKETMQLSDVLGSTEDTSTVPDISEYDIGGLGTQRFYLNDGGTLRAYGTEEELSVAEIDGTGVLRDEEGRELGRIDEGYVYDSEGNRVGFIDTEISDDWQLELLEQQLADADTTLGRDIFGPEEEEADRPAYVSKMRREVEGEDE